MSSDKAWELPSNCPLIGVDDKKVIRACAHAIWETGNWRGWPRTCISNRFPGDADAASLAATRAYTMLLPHQARSSLGSRVKEDCWLCRTDVELNLKPERKAPQRSASLPKAKGSDNLVSTSVLNLNQRTWGFEDQLSHLLDLVIFFKTTFFYSLMCQALYMPSFYSTTTMQGDTPEACWGGIWTRSNSEAQALNLQVLMP